MAVYAIVADGAIDDHLNHEDLQKDDIDIDFQSQTHTTTSTIVAPTFKPALSPSVHLSLTVIYSVLYSVLFLFVYTQLWMILYYKHRRLSYQTVFLFLCLIWSGLRITLFSFYFNDCVAANTLPIVPEWLLYCFPVCLQFMTICLLVVYFAQVLFKARAKHDLSKYKLWLHVLAVTGNIIFLLVSILSEVITFQNRGAYSTVVRTVIEVRVAINDTLFLVFGITLAVCIHRIARVSSANLVLEAKGTTRCQALSVGIVIVLLFTSRAIYNMLAITLPSIPGFGYDWINVSDQADLTDLERGYAFASFGVVLFIWEFLPTLVVVLFFRVQRPVVEPTNYDCSVASQGSRAYFFDNPRRYDSDDDLSRSHINTSPRNSMSDVSSSPYAISNSLAARLSTPKYSSTHRPLSGNSSYTGQYGTLSETSPIPSCQHQHSTNVNVHLQQQQSSSSSYKRNYQR